LSDVSFGRNVDKHDKYRIVDENNQLMELDRQDKVKDLGVWFRTVEVAFKKPRFFRFLKNLKNTKVQILGFLGFLFLKIVIVFSITY